ncbi:hypothetical protein JMUB7507_26440 [Staphylococcus aureus]
MSVTEVKRKNKDNYYNERLHVLVGGELRCFKNTENYVNQNR